MTRKKLFVLLLCALCLLCAGCSVISTVFGDNLYEKYYKGKSSGEIEALVRSDDYLAPGKELKLVRVQPQVGVCEQMFRDGYFFVGCSDFVSEEFNCAEQLRDFSTRMGIGCAYIFDKPKSGGMRLYGAAFGLSVNPLENSGILSTALSNAGILPADIPEARDARLVTAVMRNSAAYYANVREGDLLLSCDGGICRANPSISKDVYPLVILRDGVLLKKNLVRGVKPESTVAENMLRANAASDAVAIAREGEAAKSQEDVRRNGVFVEMEKAGFELYSCASGFFISQSGLLVTNAHVVEGASRFLAVDTKRNRSVSLEVFALDAENDLALLKASSPVQKQLVLAPFFRGKRGAPVMTLGYPQPLVQGAKQKATFGRVNSVTGYQDDETSVQVDIPIQDGNSGGPIIDAYGRVVGIVTSRLGGESQNVNYALKVDYLQQLLATRPDSLSSVRTVSIASLGVRDFSEIAEECEDAVALVLCFKKIKHLHKR